MKISAIMPTKNRPNNLRRIFDSVLETVSNKDLFEFSIRLDSDDSISLPVLQEYGSKLQIRASISDPTQNHGDLWNACWKQATGEIFMMCGDDFVFRTKGWDDKIRSVFEKSLDKIMLVYGDDGIQHAFLATHAFIHRKWTDALGYFAPMQFHSFYHDTWIDSLAQKINRRIYFPELNFEHMHHIAKKAPDDLIYQEMRNKTKDDDQIWEKTEGIRVQDAQKLKKVMIKSTIEKNKKGLTVLLTHGLGDLYPPLSVLPWIMENNGILRKDTKIYIDSCCFIYPERYPGMSDAAIQMCKTISDNVEIVPKQYYSSNDFYNADGSDRHSRTGPIYEEIKHDFMFYRLQHMKNWAKGLLNPDNLFISGPGPWSYEWKDGENVPLPWEKRRQLLFAPKKVDKVKELTQSGKLLIQLRKKGCMTDSFYQGILDHCKNIGISCVLIGLKKEVGVNTDGHIDVRNELDFSDLMCVVDRAGCFLTTSSVVANHRFYSNKPTIILMPYSLGEKQYCYLKADLENPNYMFLDCDFDKTNLICTTIDKWKAEGSL